MKLLFNENDGGYHNFHDDEMEAAIKAGWVDAEPIRQAIIAKKLAAMQAIAKPDETVTITVQPEVKRSPGRPKRPSILNDGE